MAADRTAALRGDITREVASLERLVSEAEQLLQGLPQPPSFLETRAAGSILHDFYTAVERTFR
jgi:hypothetical protein